MRKTLVGIVLALQIGTAAVIFPGCVGKQDVGVVKEYTAAPHATIAAAAEQTSRTIPAIQRYDRAIFNALLDMYDNNLKLLRELNIPYYDALATILRLRVDAEEDLDGWGGPKGVKLYGNAIYSLEQKLLEQQRLLFEK